VGQGARRLRACLPVKTPKTSVPNLTANGKALAKAGIKSTKVEFCTNAY
jgi:hypothetical protein